MYVCIYICVCVCVCVCVRLYPEVFFSLDTKIEGQLHDQHTYISFICKAFS